MPAWYAIVPEGKGPLGLDRIGDVGRLAALRSWRVTQGVYRFDQDLYEAVRGTPIEGDLPAEILYCPSVQSAVRDRACVQDGDCTDITRGNRRTAVRPPASQKGEGGLRRWPFLSFW